MKRCYAAVNVSFNADQVHFYERIHRFPHLDWVRKAAVRIISPLCRDENPQELLPCLLFAVNLVFIDENDITVAADISD